MKIRNEFTRSVFTVAVSALAFAAAAIASEPTYNPANSAVVSGAITAVSEVPAGQPLEGVHVTVQTKTGNVQVYLAPRNFLSFLKTNFAVGDYIEVTGSHVRSGDTDVVLAREFNAGHVSVVLRDPLGAEVWKNWGSTALLKAS